MWSSGNLISILSFTKLKWSHPETLFVANLWNKSFSTEDSHYSKVISHRGEQSDSALKCFYQDWENAFRKDEGTGLFWHLPFNFTPSISRNCQCILLKEVLIVRTDLSSPAGTFFKKCIVYNPLQPRNYFHGRKKKHHYTHPKIHTILILLDL